MRMVRIPISILSILAIGLAGCATLSTDECATGDWHKIGIQDGSDGRTVDRFVKHAKACKLDNSDTSRALYASGREKGLTKYCTTVRGYREGALGQIYYGVCPSGSSAQFMRGYELGQRIYKAEAQSSTTLDNYHAVTQKLLRAGSETERAELLREQARLESENARLKSEIQALRSEADKMVSSARKQKNL